MAVRPLDQLRQDQNDLLQEYQSTGPSPGRAAETAYPAGPPLRLATVTAVLSSDPVWGPHLVAQPQAFSDRPPTALDTSEPARRVYPSPGRVVGDYAVDECVILGIAQGAEFALKLN